MSCLNSSHKFSSFPTRWVQQDHLYFVFGKMRLRLTWQELHHNLYLAEEMLYPRAQYGWLARSDSNANSPSQVQVQCKKGLAL